MTFTQPLRVCDPCREERHDDCVEPGSLHDDAGPRLCWCAKCAWKVAEASVETEAQR